MNWDTDLGSWHTQSCNWPGGALDNCVSPEGSCAAGPPPVNGGTIMSYCHLTSNGINFSHGFGAVPGAKIRDKVLNSSCLTPTGTAPDGAHNNQCHGRIRYPQLGCRSRCYGLHHSIQGQCFQQLDISGHHHRNRF